MHGGEGGGILGLLNLQANEFEQVVNGVLSKKWHEYLRHGESSEVGLPL